MVRSFDSALKGRSTFTTAVRLSTDEFTERTALNLSTFLVSLVSPPLFPGQKSSSGDCRKRLVPNVKANTGNRNSELSILNSELGCFRNIFNN